MLKDVSAGIFGVLALALATQLFAFVVPEAAHADNRGRRALVIGVSDYVERPGAKSLDLARPYVDAEAMACRLEQAYGFSVTRMLSPPADVEPKKTCEPGSGKANMAPTFAAVRSEWTDLVAGLNAGDVAVVYFAGHGVELKGRNYLLPSDVDFSGDTKQSTGHLTESAIDFQWMLEVLAERQKAFADSDDGGIIGIFIIDACRNNPFPFAADIKDSNSVGLVAGKLPTSEIFVMYSSGIGQVAYDGAEDAPHSPFAEALLDELSGKPSALAAVAQSIRLSVYKKSLQFPDDRQTPAYYDQLVISRRLTGERAEAVKFENVPLPHAASPAPGDSLIECAFCPEMVVVDKGSFDMGSSDDEPGHGGFETQRKNVRIEKRFAIGKFEVTQREWDRCVEDKVCSGAPHADPKRPSTGLYPVTNVSWDDAQDFVTWLNTKATDAKDKYRLPTEAEWEYAARAGTKTAYPFGAKADDNLCLFANGADSEVGLLPGVYRYCSDGVGRGTAQVGRYKPNAWGLNDMLGNVWEWVADEWHSGHAGRPETGAAWGDVKAKGLTRVARGGSWRSGADALRSASRNAFAQGHARATLGFRVARTLD